MSDAITERLVTLLTPDAIAAKKDRHFKLACDQDVRNGRLAATAGNTRAANKLDEQEQKELRTAIETGCEEVPVKCIMVKDFSAFTVMKKRTDDPSCWPPEHPGGVVSERPMTDVERQGRLNSEAPKDAPSQAACGVCAGVIHAVPGVDDGDLSCAECHFGPLCEDCYQKTCDAHHAPAPIITGDQDSAGEVAHA